MERFVEYEQVGVFDKGAREQHQALLAVRDLGEGFPDEVFGVEKPQPLPGGSGLLRSAAAVQAHRVEETGGDHFFARDGLQVVGVHLGRDVADAFLDVPDAFAGASSAVEQDDVVGIRLGVVAADQAQERRFSGTVGSDQRPFLSAPHRPVHIPQDGVPLVGNVHAVHLNGDGERSGRVDGCREVERLGSLLAEQPGFEPGIVLEILAAHRRKHFHRAQGQYPVDPLGDVCRIGDHQDALQQAFFAQGAQHPVQHCTRGGVQADKGIVQDEHTGGAAQGAGYEQFAQFPAGEGDGAPTGQVSYLEAFPSEGLPLAQLGKDLLHPGRGIRFGGVPALLVVHVPQFGGGMDVVEGKGADGGRPFGVIYVYDPAAQGNASGQQAREQAFSGAVGPDHGPRFALGDAPVHRAGETEFGAQRYGGFYAGEGFLRLGHGKGGLFSVREQKYAMPGAGARGNDRSFRNGG